MDVFELVELARYDALEVRGEDQRTKTTPDQAQCGWRGEHKTIDPVAQFTRNAEEWRCG